MSTILSKPSRKLSISLIIVFISLFSSFFSKLQAHSVQIAYCVSCNGDLRIFVEHWHSTEALNSTTMTISLTINGVTTTQTASPQSGLQDTPFASLPGCSTPITVAAACPGDANTYNDWVIFDYTGLPCGVPISFTIISGNTAFTSDGCAMYPLTAGFTISCGGSSALPDVYNCAGVPTAPIIVPPGTTWSNSNPGIGLPASGVGNIPSFVPVGPTSNGVISYVSACGTNTFTIYVTPSPAPSFTTTTVCAGGPTNFTDLSTPGGGPPITTWNWDFGSGGSTSTSQNPSFTYPGPGVYTATLTVDNGCAQSVTNTVNVIGQPVAAFTAPPVCVGAITNFANTSVNGTTYAWDFGDPGSGGSNTSTLLTPGHTFTGAGNYVVTLTVTATGGCFATTTQNIVVNALPVPSFNVTSVCQGANTTFNNLTPAAPAISNWGWDYENNGSVDNTTQNPAFIYPAAGNYVAVLTATTTAGCTGTFNAPVAVYANPTANFTAPNVCQGFATTFTDLSVINPNPLGESITQWIWGFGGQGVSNQQNPSFTFATCNTYNITLTAITNQACTHTFNTNVTVFCKPTASFTAPPVCFGNNTTLTNTTAGATSTDWDFDSNGSIDNTTHPVLNYNLGTANTYNVSMIATNVDGCKDTINQAVVVNPLPAPSFTASPVCSGFASNFGSTSTIASGTISTYSWNFGDATPLGAGTPIAHLYGVSNTYTVSLTTTSNAGCVTTYTNTIVVNPNPVATFTATTVCQGFATVYTDQSTINPVTAGNTVTGWSWDFNGDGVPDANSNNPNNTFPVANTYPVTLTVTTNNGCVNTITTNVLVNPNPVPSFATVGVCIGAGTTFNNTTPGNPVIQNWAWDFSNDGNIDNTTMSPSNAYPAFGSYNAVLTATTTAGCVGMFNANVDVYPLPNPNFTASNLVCLGSPSQFTDLSNVPSNPGANIITNWAWDFDGNGSIDNVMQNPSNVMPNAGSTPVMLTVTTNHNCTANITLPIYVNYIPVAAFVVDDPDGCPVHPANFTDNSTITSGNVVNWVWNFGNAGGSVGQTPPTIYFDNLSNTVSVYYPVTLTVKSDSGCVNTLTQANYIQVFPTPVADFFSSNADPDSYFTLDPNFTFYNQSIGASVLNWNFGDVFDTNPITNTSTAINPTHYYASYEPYTYMVQLAVENIEGCKDTTIRPVVVKPAWTFYIPNCFTPNGDGTNDGFRGTGINLDEYNIWVFDRWGNMLWHCQDLDTYWDGKVQGNDEVCQEDTYVWKAKFRDIFGQRHEETGTVSIVK